ncbi:MAG TPA: DinB family protein [Thermoanaerobaculia bacterium]|jgi:uncharacterized damage-inducible protein DinB
MRPSESEVSPAHAAYIALVEGDDVLSAIEKQSSATQKLLASLDESRASFRYAEGKWSVKEVVGHLVDAERILGYRALAIARGDTQPLPGFDEDGYVRNANFDAWRLGDLGEAYALARRATIVFFRNLPEEAWMRRGIANAHEVTVRALAWTIAGHELHHLKTLRERYRL